MSSDVAIVPCERCGERTTFMTQVNALGETPGARVYHCPACKHLTWLPWQYKPSHRDQPSAQQQQQPQPDNKDRKD